MTDALSGGLFLPAIALAMLAWMVPVVLSWVMPEGLRPLIVLGLLATIVMFAISVGLFFFLYVLQGAPLSDLAGFGVAQNVVFFGRLGLSSALIWAPILILSIANRPRHWVKETW